MWDSRMDEEIARVLGWAELADGWHAVGDFFENGSLRITSYSVDVPAYTRSLDAAMSLLGPPGFSVWVCDLTTRCNVHKPGFSFTAEVGVPHRQAHGRSRHNQALAVCAAALRALTFYDEAMSHYVTSAPAAEAQ